MTDSCGNTYSGTWLDNKKHGQGIERTVNGDVYEGQFVNDAKHGFGIVYLTVRCLLRF